MIIFSVPRNAHVICPQFVHVQVREMVTFLDYIPELFRGDGDSVHQLPSPPPPYSLHTNQQQQHALPFPTDPYPSHHHPPLPPPSSPSPPPPSPPSSPTAHESTPVNSQMTTMTTDHQPPQSHIQQQQQQQQQHHRQRPTTTTTTTTTREYVDYIIPMAEAIPTPDYLPYGLRYDTEEDNLAFMNEIRRVCANLRMGLPRTYLY